MKKIEEYSVELHLPNDISDGGGIWEDIIDFLLDKYPNIEIKIWHI